MVTITLMGQLQTTDGERDLACEVPAPLSVRQVIQRQGRGLRPHVATLAGKEGARHDQQTHCQRGFSRARRRRRALRGT